MKEKQRRNNNSVWFEGFHYSQLIACNLVTGSIVYLDLLRYIFHFISMQVSVNKGNPTFVRQAGEWKNRGFPVPIVSFLMVKDLADRMSWLNRTASKYNHNST